MNGMAMRELSREERRTVTVGGVAIVIYLSLFFGLKGFKSFTGFESEYRRLQSEAAAMKREVQTYEAKVEAVTNWMHQARMDPSKLVQSTVVAQSTSALQKHAQASAVQISLVRETSSRGVEKELASIQVEAAGPVPALMGFLASIGNLGFPLVVDSVQFNSDPARPGLLKLSLTVVVLDFEQWKTPEVPRA